MPTLDFKGKSIVYSHHLTVSARTLEVDVKKSLPLKGGKPSLDDNLIIHGDNLHALKALMPRYGGRVNCIYIDPPYNTGNEGWVYNDNVNSPMMKDWLKNKSSVDGEDLERHDKWLCMMWPRLHLLRELLAEDGVIFVSIDDNEQHRLRMMMDEIFGEDTHMASFIWKSRQIVDSRPKSGISNDHEYIIVYCKGRQARLVGKESDKLKYKNSDNDPRGAWMSNSILGLANQKQRPNLHYILIDPKTKDKYPCPPDTGWRYSKDVLMKKVSDGRIVFPKKKEGRPREKKFLSELTSTHTGFSTVLPEPAGYTLNGTREVRTILGENIFDFPKPASLVKMLAGQISNKDAIILDSFAGSGTTAQAILELNKEDGGNRKFVLVECEENIANKITAERTRRVIKGIPKAKDGNLKNGLGGSFTYCTLGDEVNAENMLTGKNLPDYETLARHLYWTATGQSPDKIRKQRGKDGFFYETKNRLFYLIYEPKLTFLRSPESALNSDRAERIEKVAKKKRKTAFVYATHKFMSQRELTDMKIAFCQFPYVVS